MSTKLADSPKTKNTYENSNLYDDVPGNDDVVTNDDATTALNIYDPVANSPNKSTQVGLP